MLACVCFCQGWWVYVAVKLADCDCSGGRDCDEAACALGVNNQQPSEVMGTRRESGRTLLLEVQPVCVGEVGWGNGTLPPGTLRSVKLHA